MRDGRAAEKVETAGKRVRPNETVSVGKAKIRNTTSTSIKVQVGDDGVVTVTDCCLEEQGE